MATDLAQPSDRALVARAQRDDREAFGELVRRHMDGVYACALGVLADHHEAEDAAQTAFERAFERLQQLNAHENFRAWVTRIAWTVAMDRHRDPAQRRRVEMDVHDPDRPSEASGQEEWERTAELRRILADALRILPPSLRAPLLMKYVGGGKHRAIAESLATTENAVQKRIQRALHMMRRHLADTDKATDCLDILRTRGLGIVLGADFVERTMARIGEMPPPKVRHAGVAPGELLSCIAAAATTIGVVLSAFVGLHAPEAAAWPARDAGSGADVVLAQAARPRDAGARPVPRLPALETRLEPATAAAGWAVGITTYDAGRPSVSSENPRDLHIVNATGTHREVEPAYGNVTLDLRARPPFNLRAEVVIALDIDHGRMDPYTSAPEIVKTRDNWWACADDDPKPRGATRSDFRPLRRLARYSGERTRIRLIHDTRVGAYDIYIDDDLVAEGLLRRWSRGLPVTGIHVRSGDAIWPGTGKLTVVSDLHLVVAAQNCAPVAEAVSYDATMSRNTHPNTTDLRSGLRWAVRLGNLPGIEAAHRDLTTYFPTHPLAQEARGHYAEIVLPAQAKRRLSDERLTRLREAAGALASPAMPLSPADAEAAFRAWAMQYASVTEIWVDGTRDGQGGPLWSVRLPPEDYRGSDFLHQIAAGLVRAYERIRG
ncbi:sigma-70 family RNA polymerase sigma factor, partial [Candidatus Poribacteria bacterium]|nr:sigma-70 family RNA polymerase sigma factor [Candidatus Poribacteria bacterium]